MALLLLLLLLLGKIDAFAIISSPALSTAVFLQHNNNRNFCCPRYRFSSTALAMAGEPQSKPEQQKKKLLGKKEGVYSRPSAAIERGSGFFIPGLEGPKIRVAVGVVLLGGTAVNHVLSTDSASATTTNAAGNTLAEGLAVVYSILVLIQAGVEAVQELQSRIQIGASTSTSTSTLPSSKKSATTTTTASKATTEAWSASVPNDADNENWRARVAWSARTFLALTAATQMMLVMGNNNKGVVYRLQKDNGTVGNQSTSSSSVEYNDEDQQQACRALQETLAQSPSGRVALPPSHPASQTWAPGQDCVVVQRIPNSNNSNNYAKEDLACWIVTSPESLASTLTQRDLQWLGPLAKYVNGQ